MGRRRNAALALVWKRRVAEQRRSRVSITEFCSREGISPPSFYVWRKRLRKDEERTSRTSTVRRSPAVAEARRRRRNSRLFVPVRLASGPEPADVLRIELPGGTVLTLPIDVSAELATRVIQAALSARSEERPSC